ncbi:MAG: hypothetical protein ABI988_03005 [Nitrospirota bacterium]
MNGPTHLLPLYIGIAHPQCNLPFAYSTKFCSGSEMPNVDDAHPVMELLSQDHTILDRPFMEYRPFGVDDQGESIQDFAGMVIKDNIEYLEDCVRKTRGVEANHVVENLARLLNERIRDSAYHSPPLFSKTCGTATPMNSRHISASSVANSRGTSHSTMMFGKQNISPH